LASHPHQFLSFLRQEYESKGTQLLHIHKIAEKSPQKQFEDKMMMSAAITL